MLLTTQKHNVPPKAFNPAPTETPLSAVWPSWLAHAAEQILSLVPSGLCKIKIHHRHSTWYIFVLAAGSYIAICGCKQLVEVTEPAFQETPKQSQDRCKKADTQLHNAEELHWFQQLYIHVQQSPISGLVHVAKYQMFPNPMPRHGRD